MDDNQKLKLCQGCRNDFYNGHNELGVKRCWSFENAKVVTRYKIGWWVQPSKTAYTKVKTLSCHHGQYSLSEDIPSQFKL